MIKGFIRCDHRWDVIYIMYLFWGLFWLLNGGDKFFNADFIPQIGEWSAKGVLVDANTNEITHRMHGMETKGFYGVNRDAKMMNYFAQINMAPQVGLLFLYAIALFEIALGLTFLSLFGCSMVYHGEEPKNDTLYGTKTLHRVAFKMSILVFVMFITGDILFGDRTEHWEHANFFIMSLISYYLFLQHTNIEREEKREVQLGLQAAGKWKGLNRRTNTIPWDGEDRRG